MATVLIADADAERAKCLRALARQEGHRTLMAQDGASALESVLRSHPALMLADTELPDMDGYGLALAVREEIPAELVRIVLVKDQVDSEDRTTARAVGADELVPRILGDEGLLDVVRAALATRVPQSGGMAGGIDDAGLFAILQFLHQRRDTGTLSVAGRLAGTVVFAGGEIIGARAHDASGTPAFHAILSVTSGRYCFDAGLVDPSSRSIERAFDPLMMDAFASLNG